MGRSSNEQAARTRLKILGSASRLFREHGVEHVSVADIATACAVTTGAVYKHFASKDALVQEAFALAFDQAAASWRRVSECHSADLGTRSAAIIDHYFKNKPPEQTCPMVAFAPHVRGSASDDLSAQTYREGTKSLFSRFLAHMRRSRGNDRADAVLEREVQVLFAAMIGANLLSQTHHDPAWIRSVKNAIREKASNLGQRSGRR